MRRLMMGRLWRAALVVVVIVVPCSMYSFGEDHFATGDTFLKYCAVVEQDTEKLTVVELTQSIECVAYLQGFIRGVFVQKAENRMPPYCPTGSTVQQDVRVVLAYLREHPKETDKPLPGLALQALKHAYRCKQE
jgi:Rap1a immunity proteins